MSTPRRRVVQAPDPDAPRECRMMPEEGRRRAPAVDRLFGRLKTEESLDDGIEYTFAGDPGGLWSDVTAFVDEESVCCPFFTFDQRETGDGVILRVIAPADTR